MVQKRLSRRGAKYYGWRYALFLSGLLYVCMVGAGITVHYLFAFTGLVPDQRPTLGEIVRFEIDYTLLLNVVFLAVAAVLIWLHLSNQASQQEAHGSLAE